MTDEVFEARITVRFQHCDPAGIVYFPRWYEMLNEVVERWFDEALGCDFRTLHGPMHSAIPAISTNAEYKSPGLLGETVTWRLWLTRLGGSSIGMRIVAIGEDGRERATFDHVRVFADLGPPPKAQRVPEELRAKMEVFVATALDQGPKRTASIQEL